MFEGRLFASASLGQLSAVLLLATIALLVPPARAQGPAAGGSPEAACANKSSNVEITQCLGEFATKADRDLNVLWPGVLASIEGASHLTKAQRADWKAKLTAAQRNWVAFKTADCREPVGYEWFGGTGMSGAVSTCLAKHTLDRMQDLRQRYLEK